MFVLDEDAPFVFLLPALFSEQCLVHAQRAQGPNQSLAAKADVLEAQKLNFDNEGLYYARRVELTNGRFAMIGFLTAIIIEAASGRGIISQCIGYLRLSGLLGEASGFR